MNLIIAFLKNISLITFAAVWLILNKSYPKEIYVGNYINILHKDWVLYVSLGFVGLFNLIMIFFLRLLQNIPIEKLNIPNSSFWKENEISKGEFFKVLKAWFFTFMIAINSYSSFMLFKIWDLNTQNEVRGLSVYWIMGVAIVAIWVIFIGFRFKIRKYSIWD
ncbi:MAG: hypothetical protein MUC49_07865 [Raineya sp.]|jgi:hypothetical protein|nr:hypothetical protein [Raineya sp.]